MRTWRSKLHLTQGRIYSTVIVLAVLALLVPGLTHWKPAVDQKPLTGVTGIKPRALAPIAASTPSPSPTTPAVTAPPLAIGTGGSTLSLGDDLGGPSTLPDLSVGGGQLVVPPIAVPTQGVSPAATCQAAPIDDAVTKELDQLNALLKVLPTNTLSTALGLATGCNDANPALFAVGALTELGDDVSTAFGEVPGASSLTFPKIHAIELPSVLLPLLASLKPVFEPICGEINSASNIVLLIAPHYPQIIDGATAEALFQSAVTCAQLTGASQ